jgi:replicative DNA helicase
MGQNYKDRGKGRSQQPIDNTYGHLQPQALEVEKAVLGAEMIDRDAYALIANIISSDSYYEPRHKMIQEAIIRLQEKGKPVDVLTVTQQLASMGCIEEVGGPAYIAELSSKVASSANIEYHAKIIAEKYLSRQLIGFGSDIQTKAYDETIDRNELLAEASDLLYDISYRNTSNGYKTFKENISDTAETIRAAASSPDGITGVPSFRTIDEVNHGWQKSDLVIIAARPAMGKTSFALSLARIISLEYGRPCGFFSLEMNRVQLTKRIISNVCSIDGSILESGKLQQRDWDRFYEKGGDLPNAPLFIDDTPRITINELRNKARRMVRENGVEIIFIDYLQLMSYDGKRFGTRQEEVSAISRGLKVLAKELDIPIIALSQLNRGVENRDGLDGKRPRLSDLRESGSIEQDADTVLFVHRPEYYHIYQDNSGNDLTGKAEIIFAKNRKGPTPSLIMTFEGNCTRFDDGKTINN